jgi:hypothetical protein
MVCPAPSCPEAQQPQRSFTLLRTIPTLAHSPHCRCPPRARDVVVHSFTSRSGVCGVVHSFTSRSGVCSCALVH